MCVEDLVGLMAKEGLYSMKSGKGDLSFALRTLKESVAREISLKGPRMRKFLEEGPFQVDSSD